MTTMKIKKEVQPVALKKILMMTTTVARLARWGGVSEESLLGDTPTLHLAGDSNYNNFPRVFCQFVF